MMVLLPHNIIGTHHGRMGLCHTHQRIDGVEVVLNDLRISFNYLT